MNAGMTNTPNAANNIDPNKFIARNCQSLTGIVIEPSLFALANCRKAQLPQINIGTAHHGDGSCGFDRTAM